MIVPPDLSVEERLWQAGLTRVAGIDEAGRGALAGPVSAAAVVLPPDPSIAHHLAGLRDSKQMTPLQRDRLAPLIKTTALAWKVAFCSAEEIDRLGILPATRLAAQRALDALAVRPEYLITDFLLLTESPLPQTALVKGDQRCLSIAAASVLAKTARDALMRELDEEYPTYGFSRHKGYGTLQHRNTVARLGRCAIHRKSFSIKTTRGRI